VIEFPKPRDKKKKNAKRHIDIRFIKNPYKKTGKTKSYNSLVFTIGSLSINIREKHVKNTAHLKIFLDSLIFIEERQII